MQELLNRHISVDYIRNISERIGHAFVGTGEATGIGHAHGKAILIGEHTVVHGAPAIAIPLPAMPVRAVARPYLPDTDSDVTSDKSFGFVAGLADTKFSPSGPRVAVEEALRQWGLGAHPVRITVDCDIPFARGLGSSAAITSAAVRAVADLYGRRLDTAALYDFVQCGEQIAHGRASGVDARAVLATGPIWFYQGAARAVTTELDAALVIADTGMPGVTERAVTGVSRLADRDPVFIQRLVDHASGLVHVAANDLAAGDAESLGHTMSDFQRILVSLGVSTPSIDLLVSTALGAGAFGAKLTGAGMGGCVVALTSTATAGAVSRALRRVDALRTWTVDTRGRHLSTWPASTLGHGGRQ
ncbi:mevalonate kinase [Nocardia sp. NPDC058658]|uniref:mevalonate kinase n=1 Tax=Nocardia sp. NPDC058658 TaxID=3346580 RepID=UPI00366A3099